MDWISLKEHLPTFILAPAVFLAWLVVLWLIKRFAFFKLRRWAHHTKTQWDDILIKALSFPIDFLIVASGLALLVSVLSLPDKAEHVITRILQGCVILTVVLFADGVVKVWIDRSAHKGVFHRVSAGMARGLMRGFIVGIGILAFLDLIGISITPILASLGIGSLAVALALQDTLSNFFAGIYVAVDRPVELDQFVKLESGEEGYVLDIGWRSTRIKTLANNIVIIPNAKLMSSVITNYSLIEKESAVTVEVGVHYKSDLNRVEKIAYDVAQEVSKKLPSGVKVFNPQIRFHSFGDSAIQFTVMVRAKEISENSLVKHELIKALHERFKKEGIEIPYPTRTIISELK